MLSPHQVQQYKEQGFCIVSGFLNETSVQALRAEIDAVAAGATVENHDRAQLEMEPDQGPEGTQVRRIYEPCDRYPLHRDLALTPELLDCMEQLVGPDILFHYSKINMKPARIGSVVEWHQDLAYYPLTNPDSVTVLFYLDPADRETGCLRVIPSMHRRPLLDHTMDGYFAGKVTEAIDESGAIELVAPAGSAIFMHCLTPHSSRPNRSPRQRRTLILSYRAADAYSIYMGEMTVKGETPVRLVRGQARPVARFEFRHFPIPRYLHGTSSLYELQEETRQRARTVG